jgi:hypothetical protein
MAQSTWEVHMNQSGRPLDVEVKAHTQAEARRIAEGQYPGYKAGRAKRA